MLPEPTSSNINERWQFRVQNIPNKFFGHGCVHKFDHYISGESRVEINTLEELCHWLMECRYIPDPIKKAYEITGYIRMTWSMNAVAIVKILRYGPGVN